MQNKSNINLTFSYVNDKVDLTSAKKKIIRISSKGFCIAVIPHEKTPELLYQYTFTSNSLSLEDKFNAIADVDKELNIACENNSFRLYTQSNVQVPEEFYDSGNEKTILPLMVEKPEQYTPFAENVSAWKLYNISAWGKDLHSGLIKKFPNYKLSTVLSSLLPIVARKKSGKNALIFVEDYNFTIIAVDGDKLLGANTFVFSNEGDFIYYSSVFLRKMYAHPDDVSLKLCGNIAPQSPIHSILNRYFTNVEMLSCSEDASGNYSYFCDLFE